ncbi:MAG: NAD(P)-dependent alcohol dehydrogenase [Armatimonadota bacterium]
MRVLRLHAPLDMRIHDEPVPVPGPGEALVRVGSVGVCASDVHWWRHGRIGGNVLTDPLVLGHEAAGTVETVGEGVPYPKPGQRVAIEPAKACGRCEFCMSGNYNVCPSVDFFGTPPTDGCFRDYVVWPASLMIPIPDSISMDEAAMLEPLAVGIYAADLASVRPGERAAVLGAGAIGLSVMQSLKICGAGDVLVCDPIPARRETALKLGADVACDPSEVHDAAKAMTSGRGFDLVFECAGDINAVRETARLARVLGRVIIVGIPKEDEYPFDAGSARRKQLKATFVRRSNLTGERAVELVHRGKINAASLATHTFPLEETDKAMKLAESKTDGVIRAVIRL